MASPTDYTSNGSTTLSQFGLTGSMSQVESSAETQEPNSRPSLPSPTTATSQVGVLDVKKVRFLEAPLHQLLEKEVKDMTDEELKAHVEMLRGLRKSPQTLSAKLKSDEDAIEAKVGPSGEKVIRTKVALAAGVKPKARTVTPYAKSNDLAAKWGVKPT